ncbi:hypothetical protein PhCBS80983_g03198 [Powellomyces hirtus]|uniref:JmjC domain-containing protein n=1 Tax=Powellomyces hirtus TaxID=109895 RepID=A0A507E2T7_9FUNG|nr:hypothetical protein PhCBS80983_g03198 [Powellomyces hirtus]
MDEEKTLVAPEDQNEDVARNVSSPTSPDAGDLAPHEFVPEAKAHQNLTPEDTSRTRASELLAPKHNVPSPPPLTAKGDVSNATCDTALEVSITVTKGSIGSAASRAKSFLTEEDDPVARPETSAASSSAPPLQAKEDTRDAAVEDSILASGRPMRRAALRAKSLLKEEDEQVAQAPSKKIVETSAAPPSSPSLTAAMADSIKHTCNTAPENSTERPTRRIASRAKSNLEEEEEPVARAPSRKIVKTSAAPSTTLVHDVDTVGMQVQNGSCQSSRYKHFEKCQSCISKNGQPCRFYDLRAFYTDEQGYPLGEPSFLAHKSNDDWAVVPAPGEFPSLSSSARYSLLFSHKEFQDNVKHELTHIQAKNAPPHRVRAPIPNTRQMCDFCEQGIYNTYYICKQCGKDLCLLCVEEGWRSHKAQEFTIPEVHKCTYKRTHGMQNFLILSRWNVKQMENACSWVEGWVEQHGPSVQQEVATGERSLAAAMDLMMDIDDSSRKAPPAIDNTPALNSPVTSEDFQIDNLLNAPHPDLVIVPYKDLTLSLFQKCWRERKVVFVTEMDDRVDDRWSPTAFSAAAGDDLATIVNCVTGELQHESPLGPFFEGFGKRNTGAPRPNLKLKDWPTDMHFRHKLPEICGKFLDLIPVPEYTHPTGTFNLAGQIPDEDVPPDLGPKMYAAYGYEPEETGATTKLHLDVADAANVMVWSKPHWTPPSTSSPDGTTPLPSPSPPGSRRDGAIWDLFPPSSISALRNYLRTEYTPAYSHIADPIHDQMFYLHPHHLHAVATRHEITPIRLHQRVGDTVFIPAGFAHQVANYGDCIKCALDFVSPEGLPVCEHLCHEFRRLPRGHGRRGDTVCVGKIVWSVVKAAMAESGPQ